MTEQVEERIEKEQVKYGISWKDAVVSVSFSEKIMMRQYEPSEVAASIQIPIESESAESTGEAITEIMGVIRDVVSREIAKLKKIRAIERGLLL